MLRPLWPNNGVEYDKALAEAKKEYDEWMQSRKGKQTIQVYSRKQEDGQK